MTFELTFERMGWWGSMGVADAPAEGTGWHPRKRSWRLTVEVRAQPESQPDSLALTVQCPDLSEPWVCLPQN